MAVLRHSTLQDIDAMMDIVNAGKELLCGLGIDQWQKGYPNRELLITDVHEKIGYVLEEDGAIAGICAVTFTDEEAYRGIRNGSWLTPDDCRYATIHRGAIAKEFQGRGLTTALFSLVEKLAAEKDAVSMRADTHPENMGMQRSLEKAGFVRCGEIILSGGPEDGDMRVAYEKLLK